MPGLFSLAASDSGGKLLRVDIAGQKPSDQSFALIRGLAGCESLLVYFDILGPFKRYLEG